MSSTLGKPATENEKRDGVTTRAKNKHARPGEPDLPKIRQKPSKKAIEAEEKRKRQNSVLAAQREVKKLKAANKKKNDDDLFTSAGLNTGSQGILMGKNFADVLTSTSLGSGSKNATSSPTKKRGRADNSKDAERAPIAADPRVKQALELLRAARGDPSNASDVDSLEDLEFMYGPTTKNDSDVEINEGNQITDPSDAEMTEPEGDSDVDLIEDNPYGAVEDPSKFSLRKLKGITEPKTPIAIAERHAPIVFRSRTQLEVEKRRKAEMSSKASKSAEKRIKIEEGSAVVSSPKKPRVLSPSSSVEIIETPKDRKLENIPHWGEIRSSFRNVVVPVIAHRGGVISKPWTNYTLDNIKTLWDEFFPEYTYKTAHYKYICDRVKQQMGNWRNGFVKSALESIRQDWANEGYGDHDKSDAAIQKRKNNVEYNLGDQVLNIPFVLGTPGDESTMFLSKLVLQVFASHLTFTDGVPVELIKTEHPIGALMLSVMAIHHVFLRSKSGAYIAPGKGNSEANFSELKYGEGKDKPKGTSSWLPLVTSLSQSHWDKIIRGAEIYRKGKSRVYASDESDEDPDSELSIGQMRLKAFKERIGKDE